MNRRTLFLVSVLFLGLAAIGVIAWQPFIEKATASGKIQPRHDRLHAGPTPFPTAMAVKMYDLTVSYNDGHSTYALGSVWGYIEPNTGRVCRIWYRHGNAPGGIDCDPPKE